MPSTPGSPGTKPADAPDLVHRDLRDQKRWEELFHTGSQLLVTARSSAAYRPGEWAWLHSVVLYSGSSQLPRLCYRLVYLDGMVDHLPLVATSTYQLEFYEVSA